MEGKVKLTPKETEAILKLKELAKTWPRSLALGSDTDSSKIAVWKKGTEKDLYSAAQVCLVNIKNEDSW